MSSCRIRRKLLFFKRLRPTEKLRWGVIFCYGVGLQFLQGRYPAAMASSHVRKKTRFTFFIRIPDLQSKRPNILPGRQPAYFPGRPLVTSLPFFRTLYFFSTHISLSQVVQSRKYDCRLSRSHVPSSRGVYIRARVSFTESM